MFQALLDAGWDGKSKEEKQATENAKKEAALEIVDLAPPEAVQEEADVLALFDPGDEGVEGEATFVTTGAQDVISRPVSPELSGVSSGDSLEDLPIVPTPEYPSARVRRVIRPALRRTPRRPDVEEMPIWGTQRVRPVTPGFVDPRRIDSELAPLPPPGRE